MWPYLKNVQVLVCPSGTSTMICGRPFRPDWGDEPGENPEWTSPGLSYGFNIMTNGINVATVRKPAQVVAVGESRYGHEGNCGNYSGCPYAATVAGIRHNDGANAVFFDGHAKWLKRDQYLDPRSWDETHPDNQ